MVQIDGTSENDVLLGSDGNDTINAFEGDDVIYPGLGADTIYGGLGSDSILFTGARIESPVPPAGLIDGGDGIDIIDARNVSPVLLGLTSYAGSFSPTIFVGSQQYVISNIEKILFDVGDNYISPGDLANPIEVRAGIGNDYFSVYPTGSYYGEQGNDNFFISGDFGGTQRLALADGGEGSDTQELNIGFDVDLAAQTAVSGDAHWTVTGFERVQVSAISGYSTTVRGSEAAETFEVRSLSDDGTVGVVFDGRGGNDILSGSKGSDSLNGGEGDDTLDGGDGNDTLRGDGGNDVLKGGEGKDILYSGTGLDQLIGGAGNDRYMVSDANTQIVENAGSGQDELVLGVSYVLAAGQSIENVNLSLRPLEHTANDLPIDFTGNEFGQIVTGTDGINAIQGLGANDWLHGYGGDDTLDGGDGQDTLDGGTGQDWLMAGADGDTLTGGNGHDSLWAGGGNDLIEGGTGDDTLSGNEGTDTVTYAAAASGVEIDLSWMEEQNTRGAGIDTLVSIENLVGSAFDDRLAGNAANNILTGGGGADRFVFAQGAWAGGIDTISDFDAAQGDKIVLSATDFGLAPGSLPGTAFVIGTAAGDADDRLIYNSATGALQFDADGSGAGAAVHFADLLSAPSLMWSDFFIV
jgi:Ca2+-binding RTX toxin-like protein